MEEQQEIVPLSDEQLNLETLRSQTKDLSDILRTPNDSSNESPSELKSLLQDLKCQSIIKEVGFSNFDSLQPQNLVDAYMKDAMEQLNFAEAENSKLYAEMKVLTSTYIEDSIQLERDIEGLDCSLKFLKSEGMDKLELGGSVECSTPSNGSLVNQHEDYNFKILELDHQIKKRTVILSFLEDLDDISKRFEAVGQIEDMFTGLKVVEFDGNEIRLSLETFIPTLDDLVCQQKMEFTNNPRTVIHELIVDVCDGTMELRNVEIFPNDVFIGEIIDDAKSSWKLLALLPLQGITSSFQCLVKKVQDRIFLCTLRQLIVKDANKSRHSFEYIDKDGTVIAHMVGGVDAFIKLPYCWPLVNSTLKLISLRSPNNCTKELSLSSYNVEELGSSLDVQTQQNLLNFVDAIEKKLAQRM